ncbi:MAG: 2-dehydropantoate 2-reductase [Magnetococcales bacterium]|nr:2-dehydropantoate 2-reductase [Magnetococcales bacterium]
MEPGPGEGGPPPLRVLTVGAGAVGGFYSAKLAQGGARVSTVHRSDFQEVVRAGIRVESIHGDFHFTPHRVWEQVADATERADYILVATKVLPLIDTAAVIAPAVGPGTVIVMLQNGIEIEGPVARAFPDNEIVSGLAFVCLSRLAPGRIAHLCHGRVVLGRYPSGLSPAAERLAACFRKAGIPCVVTDDIALERWRKLVWNAAFNPISVLSGGMTTTAIMADREIRQLVEAVMAEVVDVAASAGHRLPEGVIAKNLEDTMRMQPYRTSMLLDWENGRSLEVEAILGNLVSAARRLGVATPRCETLYALLTSLTTARPDAARGV